MHQKRFFKNYVLIFVLGAVLSLLAFPPKAYAVDYSYPEQTGPFSLNSGDILTITSGTYTKNLYSIPQNAKIIVKSGANFSNGNYINVSGTLIVEENATATLKGIALNTGFTIDTKGTMTFSQSANINGTGTFTVAPSGTILMDGYFGLINGAEFLNRGKVEFSQNVNIGKGSTVLNYGTLKGVSQNGSLNVSGILKNTGIFESQGTINLNSGSEVINFCAFIAEDGFTNNSEATQNRGIILTTNKKSTISINAPMLNAPGAYLQSDGTSGNVNFVNNARSPGFHGGGSVYVLGKSTNNGVFGSANNPINFYDDSSKKGQIFDKQNIAPDASTTQYPITPLSLEQVRSMCAYSPLNVPPIANPDTLDDQEAGTTLQVPVILNDQEGDLQISTSSIQLRNENGLPVTILTIEGIGEWNVLPTGEVRFVPIDTSITSPPPISYRISDTAGNLSKWTSVSVSYKTAQQAVLSSNKTVSMISQSPIADCSTSPPLPDNGNAFLPGACIEYLITIKNEGPGPVTNLILEEYISTDLFFRGATTAGFGAEATLTLKDGAQACQKNNCNVHLSKGMLEEGASGQLRIRAVVQ